MNRLQNEKSPYLLQHADNPVDWYPWGDEAFQAARDSDRPVFLSIGYSTCHWCHVMKRESFQDETVASLMNNAFIAIKVDREERPDIDHVYMSVCQVMTGSGGWPLTIIMTPDKKPFFAGTYIPKYGRHGQSIGMVELIPAIVRLWKTNRAGLIQNADQILSHLQGLSEKGVGMALQTDLPDSAYEELREQYDVRHGGFGSAPKFPMPHVLSFLLRYWKRTGVTDALEMVENTLQNMRMGGIYDHIGSGFHRYATDSAWVLPHFEKMLYDQALLAIAYTEAWQATQNPLYEKTAREILAYVRHDLRSPEGGFCCAQDAETEGEEGKYYFWTAGEFERALDPESATLIKSVFNIQENGNFTEPFGESHGSNVLYRSRPWDELARSLDISAAQLQTKIDAALAQLDRVRRQRTQPHRDDKILTDWNGLMIAAFAKAASAFGEESYLHAARTGTRFILNRLRSSEGKLLHRYRDNQADIPAFLDDYAFFIWGLLETYGAGFDVSMLETALALTQDMITRFWDERDGAFFFTASDAVETPIRKKESQDSAIPSGNAVAMFNLLRLARMTGDVRLEEKADRLFLALSGNINAVPSAHAYFMIAAEFALSPSSEVVLAGRRDSDSTREMLRALQTGFNPNRIVLFRASDATDSLERLADFVSQMKAIDSQTTAYVCVSHACRQPVVTVQDLLKLLEAP